MKRKLIISLFTLLLLFFIYSISVEASVYDVLKEEEAVDVILFWGQSNMVGRAGKYDSENNPDKRKLDNLLDDLIDQDILDQYEKMNYVSVQIPNNVAFEYRIDASGKGYLKEITSATKTLGQNLTYKNNKIYQYNESTKNELGYISLHQSSGTNMIPQFCKTYYEATGRKVVVVMAAKGGQKIAQFLPATEQNNNEEKTYIYEALKAQYLGAIKLLESKNIKIGKKFYVVDQGGSDTKALNTAEAYYNTFSKVHNNIINDLNIEFGAIVEICGRISYYYAKDEDVANEHQKAVNLVHLAQEKLAKNNDNIIIGTDLPWTFLDKQNPKYEAFCLKDAQNKNETTKHNNTSHYTSATLSQIGKNTANSIVKYLYPPVDTITFISENEDLSIGDTVQLNVEVLPSDAYGKTLTWSSSNKQIATVDKNGCVTTKKAGTVTITAISENNTKATTTLRVTSDETLNSNTTTLYAAPKITKSINETELAITIKAPNGLLEKNIHIYLNNTKNELNNLKHSVVEKKDSKNTKYVYKIPLSSLNNEKNKIIIQATDMAGASRKREFVFVKKANNKYSANAAPAISDFKLVNNTLQFTVNDGSEKIKSLKVLDANNSKKSIVQKTSFPAKSTVSVNLKNCKMKDGTYCLQIVAVDQASLESVSTIKLKIASK